MAKTWQPNPIQTQFLACVKANPGKTLKQLSKIANANFTSGAMNTLTAKGLIKTEKVSIACNIVDAESGEILGTTNRKVMAYFIVE